MANATQCPKCGRQVANDMREGICPVCALQGALSEHAPEAVVTEKPGDFIGRYKLIELLGEGGCGIVYSAEQEEPIRRQVALKVIKLGMDTRQVIARFEAERQVLAFMDHPNIARVLDAGSTDTGRPFFVMELVRGTRITDYCDHHSLSIRARLDLFMQVCQAVQHAHQKGIIHRDIKPSNILVTEVDGRAVPKVIDFGIAKATQQALNGKTLLTSFQQFIGTPAYMSPEQAGLAAVDVDTRSDIYGLGVLLYELLTGHLPFEREELVQVAFDEMCRIIREKEPTKPSTFLSLLTAADLTKVARHQGTDPPKVIQVVRGDLDWIVMKCLEKDRTRRYETASGLADDVQRHLKNEPVKAAAPSAFYRVNKFVRRHRVGLATATVLMLLLIAGVAVSSWQAVQATRAKREAQTVSAFLKDMLNGVRPAVALGRDTALLRRLLDKVAARAEKELNDRPRVQVDLLVTIGGAYLDIGEYAKAETVLRRALAVEENLSVREYQSVANCLSHLAHALQRQGKLAEAEPIVRKAMAMSKHLRRKGQAYDATGFNNLAFVLWNQGGFDAEAEAIFRDTLAMRRTLHDPMVFTSLMNIANVLLRKGKAAEAELACREGLAVMEKFVNGQDPQVAVCLDTLARALKDQGKLAEAEAMYREALGIQKGVLGNEHPDVAASLNGLADVLSDRGKLVEAKASSREALAIGRKLFGNEHPDVAVSLNVLAGVLRAEGKMSEAESIYKEALAIDKRLLGNEHGDIAACLNNLSIVLRKQHKLAEAEAASREALAMTKRLSGSEHPGVAACFENLAAVIQEQGKLSEAEQLFRDVVAMDKKLLQAENPRIAVSLNDLAGVLCAEGKLGEAEGVFREVLAMRTRLLGSEHPDTAQSLDDLVLTLVKERKMPEAERLGRNALAIRKRVLGKEHLDVADTLDHVVVALCDQNKLSEAEIMAREALAIRQKHFGTDDKEAANSLGKLAQTLQQEGKLSEAEALYRQALIILQKNCFGDNSHVAALNDLAGVLLEQGKTEEADRTAREAISKRNVDSPEYPEYARSLGFLARILYQRSNFDGAEAMAREVLAIHARNPLKSHADIFGLSSLLGLALWQQERHIEGEILMVEAGLVEFGFSGLNGSSHDIDRAIALLTESIQKGRLYDCLVARAFLLGRQGRWNSALEDLSEAQKQRKSLLIFMMAPLLAEAGDGAAYASFRRKLLAEYWGSEDPETAAQKALGLLLRPGESGLNTAGHLVDTAVNCGTNLSRLGYFQFVKALAEQRRGSFEDAAAWAGKSIAGSGTNFTTGVAAEAVLAMAQYQLGQATAADQSLHLADGMFRTKLPQLESGDLGKNWPDWLIAKVLLSEARNLIMPR